MIWDMKMKIKDRTEELVYELPKGLLKWYDFHKEGRALCVTGGTEKYDLLADVLLENCLEVDTLDRLSLEEMLCEKEDCTNGVYNYIVVIGVLECCEKPGTVLKILKDMLHPSGKLLLGMDNRLGIRYFCGERDPFTLRLYDGIDNYSKVGNKEKDSIQGRNFSMAEIKEMLKISGFKHYKFYSVFPALQRPQILLAEGYTPNEAMDIRVFPQYNSPETVFLEEGRLYESLIKESMLHTMANGYFIECSLKGGLHNIDQITLSMDRGPENSLVTMVKAGEYVAKRALYEEGREKIKALMENTEYLKAHHVPVVEAKIKSDSFWMPYCNGQIATVYFQELLQKDKEKFLSELTHYFDIILGSSEHIPYSEVNWEQFEPGWEKRKGDDPNIDKWRKAAFSDALGGKDIGVILKRGYIDMVSLNSFYTEGGFVFFDQEFYIENLPANVIMIRTIDCIYRGKSFLNEILPVDDVLKCFHLYEHRDIWRKYVGMFIRNLRNEKELACYHKEHRCDLRVINANRMRMNFSQEEYEKLFFDIFRNLNGRKVYLFGSGIFAKKFLEQFGSVIEIEGILDNNETKWGNRIGILEIQSPQVLADIVASCKVIICIKRYEQVLTQLRNMGVKDISIYNHEIDYPLPLKSNCIIETKQEDTKKYNIGYIAGVFDLFHVGHLNLFKRAKQQCNYLIVGVVSDEQVMQNKKTTPYIPFTDRLEIVKSCKYVDEAVEIPFNRPSTEDAFRRYRFDVQFSGSDYESDPDWLAKQTYLRKHGSDLVFFPYTESISSSKLKEKILDIPI